MNKKIFAALASATMALSATGSLAVFAEDFDVVEENNNGTANGTITPASEVVINDTNFPDDDFRQGIIDLTGKTYGQSLKTADLDKVTDLTINATGPTTATTSFPQATSVIKVNPNVENLKGIEFFSKLTDLTVAGLSKLESVDLEANTKLKNLSITDASDLEELSLPATSSLTGLTVSGAATGVNAGDATQVSAPITVLDLSKNKALQNVTITYTNVANIDLSNNPCLTEVTLYNNGINTLNLEGSLVIEELDASYNHLYSLELPENSPELASLNVAHNMLQELTIPSVNALATKVDVSDNELRSIDLSDIPASVTSLNIENNHIAGIDLSSFTPANVTAGNQIIYVGADYNTVDLTAYSDDFDKSNVDGAATNGVISLTPSTVEYTVKTGVVTGIGSQGAQYTYTTGATGKDLTVFIVPADILNRLYNPNSGEHFYTKDLEEKDVLVGLGWQDEGIGWTSPVDSNKPVYRLYNPNAGDHHYTTNPNERDILANIGWKYEGIGWYSAEGTFTTTPASSIDTVPVYREYNPNAKAAGAHNYTTNEAENDFLVSVGWLEEGLGWYAMK